MKVSFKEDVNNSGLCFDDIDDDNFFVDQDGSLCQKYCNTEYHVICDEYGSLICSKEDDVNPSTKILRAVNVSVIEF